MTKAEAKLKAQIGGAAKGKEFTFGELEGLRRVFGKLENSNPKRSGKVDYWFSKNQTVLDKAWKQYLKEDLEVLKKYAVFEDFDKVNYLVEYGKDGEDLIYFADGAFFRKTDGKMAFEPKPYWELESPATEEGKEPTKKLMEYKIKFNEGLSADEYTAEITALQTESKYSIELWTLNEEYLEGLSVIWKTANKEGQLVEDLTGFRDMLYDNAITQTV